ncbi:MAG: hypothetical protein AAF616_09985 [Bacteroidota bacterium]
MKKSFLLIACLFNAAILFSQVRINEVRVQADGFNAEQDYIELTGPPGFVIPSNYRIIQIADGPPNPGGVQTRIQGGAISGLVFPSDGILSLGRTSDSSPDEVVSAVSFNGFQNSTIMIVESGFIGFGTDVDSNNDGVIDNAFWTTIIDGVGLVEVTNADLQEEINQGATNTTLSSPWDYSVQLGLPSVVQQVGGNKTALHIYKDPITGSWKSGSQTTVDDPDNNFETVGDPNNSFITEETTLSSDALVSNLTVEGNGDLTIASGATLSVSSSLVNDADMTISSGGSLLFDGTTTGNAIIINRTSQHAGDALRHSMVGSPVGGFSLDDLGANSYFSYNEGSASWSAETSNSTMAPGQGFSVVGKTNLSFAGTPNSGSISVPATASAFKLLANPYPCAIDIDAFFAENTAALSSETIWLWNDGGSEGGVRPSSDYLTINSMGQVQSGGTGAKSSANFEDGSIGSVQGFFVETSAGGTSISFTDAMKKSGANTDDAFFRTAEIQSLKLILANASHFSETLLGFASDATLGFDNRYDAKKRKGSAPVQLSILVNQEEFAIATNPLLQGAEIALPLNFTGSAGNYTFSISELKNIPEGYLAILKDKSVRTYHVLNDGDYAFSTDGLGNSSRFEILLSTLVPAPLSNENGGFEDLRIFNGNRGLTVRSSEQFATADILDLQGKVVYSELPLTFEGNESILDVSLKQNGLYIIRFDGDKSIRFIY